MQTLENFLRRALLCNGNFNGVSSGWRPVVEIPRAYSRVAASGAHVRFSRSVTYIVIITTTYSEALERARAKAPAAT